MNGIFQYRLQTQTAFRDFHSVFQGVVKRLKRVLKGKEATMIFYRTGPTDLSLKTTVFFIIKLLIGMASDIAVSPWTRLSPCHWVECVTCLIAIQSDVDCSILYDILYLTADGKRMNSPLLLTPISTIGEHVKMYMYVFLK